MLLDTFQIRQVCKSLYQWSINIKNYLSMLTQIFSNVCHYLLMFAYYITTSIILVDVFSINFCHFNQWQKHQHIINMLIVSFNCWSMTIFVKEQLPKVNSYIFFFNLNHFVLQFQSSRKNTFPICNYEMYKNHLISIQNPKYAIDYKRLRKIG